jgi:hypothetical protein
MSEENRGYDYSALAELQFRNLADDLDELKERVRSLEVTLARGVMLLVANLAGMAISLAQQLVRHY